MTNTSSLRAELLLSRLSPFTSSRKLDGLLDPTETNHWSRNHRTSQPGAGLQPLDTQSLSVVWPQIVALVA